MTNRRKRLELTWIGKEERPRLEPRILLLEVRQLALQLGEPVLRGLVGFLPQGLTFDLELHDAPACFVQLGGHRVDLHAQP